MAGLVFILQLAEKKTQTNEHLQLSLKTEGSCSCSGDWDSNMVKAQ